jgi:hypothetical protein
MEMAVFWVVPCSLVEVINVSEVPAASIISCPRLTHRPDNAGSKHL